MFSGYCGTLMTPMAANFNIVPAALLELDDKNAVIRAQVPTALAILAAQYRPAVLPDVMLVRAHAPCVRRSRMRTVPLTGFEPFDKGTGQPVMGGGARRWTAGGWATRSSSPPAAVRVRCRHRTAIESALLDLGEAGCGDCGSARRAARTELSIERVAINAGRCAHRRQRGRAADRRDHCHRRTGRATSPRCRSRRDGARPARGGRAGDGVADRRHLRLQPRVLWADGRDEAAGALPVRAVALSTFPYLPEQATRTPRRAPSLALDTLIAGPRVAVKTTLGTDTDMREQGRPTAPSVPGRRPGCPPDSTASPDERPGAQVSARPTRAPVRALPPPRRASWRSKAPTARRRAAARGAAAAAQRTAPAATCT